MEVNGVNSSTVAATGINNYENKKTGASNEATESTAAVTETNEAAVYEPSSDKKTSYKTDTNKLKQLMADNERQVSSFKKLIESMLLKQGKKSETAGWPSGNKQNGSMEEMVLIDDETRAAAQKEIGEGGYYSVENTAARLLDFAVALSGGDPSKIASLKEATIKGFEAAAAVWGGELPEISQKTYDAVMKGFDEWESSGSASNISLLNKTTGAANA